VWRGAGDKNPVETQKYLGITLEYYIRTLWDSSENLLLAVFAVLTNSKAIIKNPISIYSMLILYIPQKINIKSNLEHKNY
jgi:hypothetical protein